MPARLSVSFKSVLLGVSSISRLGEAAWNQSRWQRSVTLVVGGSCGDEGLGRITLLEVSCGLLVDVGCGKAGEAPHATVGLPESSKNAPNAPKPSLGSFTTQNRRIDRLIVAIRPAAEFHQNSAASGGM